MAIVVNATYAQVLEMRRSLNAPIFVEEQVHAYKVNVEANGNIVLEATLPKGHADEADLKTRLLGYDAQGVQVARNVRANHPIDREEIRFQTHDYSDKSTWSGETSGYPAAWFAGGLTRHPISGLYVDATGAGMLAAYATPTDPNYGNPVYLFGAAAYSIEDRYDDVTFKWYDKPLSDSTKTELCWLDMSAANPADHVWRRTSDNAIIVKYVHPTVDTNKPEYNREYRDGEWYRADVDPGTGTITWTYDTAHVVTTSIWRLLPYDDYKIEIHEAWLSTDVEAVMNGPLHYRAYSHVEAGDPALPAGYPAGIYKGRDWDYDSLAIFRAGANTVPMVEPVTLPGHSGPVITMGYDYGKTVYPVVDSLHKQRLDIEVDENTRVTNTYSAKATFVAIKLRSF